MKLIRTIRLARQQTRPVHCEIDLCELQGSGDERFLVNLRQGRKGEDWRESTRTPRAITLQAAEALFAQVLRERQAQGFADPDADATSPIPVTPQPQTDTAHHRRGDDMLLARLQGSEWKQLSPMRRSRTIWRIGERRLAAAVPAMVGLIEKGDSMQDYCIAWAIGRCGDPGALEAMRALSRRGGSDTVKRMAQLAALQLCSEPERITHADALVADWPLAMREAWASGDDDQVQRAAAQSGQWKSLSLNDWLEQLDQVALAQPFARRVLLAQLRSQPLAAGVFRAVRHLYKAAEWRDDGEVFGLLHQRFELTPPTVSGNATWVYIDRRYVRFAEEAARPDSRVAYNGATREYLRRRGWRTLRHLGNDEDPAYVAMALGALLAMDDRDAGKPYIKAAWAGPAREYGPYSHWMLFNRMLRAQGAWRSNRTGRSWYVQGTAQATNLRQEAFPQLWDTRPDALLTLLQQSRCAGVHEFAARALIDNAAYCRQISIDVLRRLLRSPYEATARFAFRLCKEKLGVDGLDTEWLILFLQSSLAEARQYALDAVSRDPARYAADAVLVGAMLCALDEAVRCQARMLCQAALSMPSSPAAIVAQLLDWLDNCSDLDHAEQVLPAITADLLWVIDNPLREAASQAPYDRLLALLSHADLHVQLLAGEWLLRHVQPTSLVPADILTALLQADDPQLRSIGVKLFGALPEHVLVEQPGLFTAFRSHPNAGVRQAIDPALQKLASSNPEFTMALLPMLVDILFRTEPGEGVHADVLQWLRGPMKSATETLDAQTSMRLLRARSKGAQQLGAWLLPRFQPADFSVLEWAQLAGNENASVRRWAFAAYEANLAQVQGQMEQALRIFDSKWDDAHTFAADFFRQKCAAEDWNPILLVSLCDHLDPQVQRFGREMLTTHFEVGDVTDYLLKLSQHPSANMQLFVSAWLESAAAGSTEHLARLETYFLSVLSQVNRGRVVKDRVLGFLQKQAEHSEAVAAIVARLFARQVATVAIGDKAQYIEALREIQARYPGLPAAMTIQPPRAYSRQRA